MENSKSPISGFSKEIHLPGTPSNYTIILPEPQQLGTLYINPTDVNSTSEIDWGTSLGKVKLKVERIKRRSKIQ